MNASLFLIIVHVGAEISQRGAVIPGGVALILKEVENVGYEVITDDPVQLSRHGDAWLFPNAGEAVLRKAGDVSDEVFRDAEV